MEPPSGVPLAIDGLTVDYGMVRAVDRLSLTVGSGEVYGLLGTNGAGKSSTIKSVVGLVLPSAGTIRVSGLDPETDPVPAKAEVGYVPESPLLYEALTPWEFFEYIASIRQLPGPKVSDGVRRYAEALQFADHLNDPIATLSQGTRQKLLLTAALLHNPRLLVLDEPFSNLDPRAARIMKELLRAYVRRPGRGILFSTHTMEVAEQLCDRVGILDRGHMVGEGTLAQLRSGGTVGTLEEAFLRLTHEEAAVREAVQRLSEP